MPKKKEAYEMPPPLPAGERLSDISRDQWCLGKSIGKGGFGEIYLASKGKGKSTTDYVIKIEPYENGPLFTELACYRRALLESKIDNWAISQKLDYLAVPKFISSGLHDFSGKRFRFMVMDRFGADLHSCFQACGHFCEDSVCYLARKLLEALQYLHACGYIHADIKGSNLLTGVKKGQEHHVYLVDYGLVHLYQSDGKHKPYKVDPKSKHNGTLEFTSVDAHNGVAPSRRTDLEILGYCLLFWSTGTLPWLKEKGEEKVAASKRKYQKAAATLVSACFGSNGPHYLVEYMSIVLGLDYIQEPPYEKLLKLFTKSRGPIPIQSLEWVKSPKKRRSSERLPGAVKYQRVDAKSAEPVGPARKKPAAKVSAKKSTSDASVAQPARPAKRKSAEGEPPAVKKSRTEDASAKPVRLAKAASMEGAAAEQKKGVSKKVPSKEKMEFAVPKTKPKFNPIPKPVLNSSVSSDPESPSVRRSGRNRNRPRVNYKDPDRSWTDDSF